MMRMVVVLVLAGLLSLGGTVYAMPGLEGQRGAASPSGLVSPHGGGNGAMTRPEGMAGVIQDAKLAGYKDVKIGEAFGKYRHFKKKVWSETRGTNGNYYVDFVGTTPAGWFDFKSRKEGISSKGIEIKFVIHPNGTYGVGMVSKVEAKTDGKTYRYSLSDINSILDAIYANKEISY